MLTSLVALFLPILLVNLVPASMNSTRTSGSHDCILIDTCPLLIQLLELAYQVT